MPKAAFNHTKQDRARTLVAKPAPSSRLKNYQPVISQDMIIQQIKIEETKNIWLMRWFFARLFAVVLLLSIPASVMIAIVTKNPLPVLVPAPLLLSMRPIIRWLFSQGRK